MIRIVMVAALMLVIGASMTVTWALTTECHSDALLQQQVSEFNKLAAKCEAAALQEDNYVMRLWHWKACMWDTQAPNFTADQIRTTIKLGLRLYEAKL